MGSRDGVTCIAIGIDATRRTRQSFTAPRMRQSSGLAFDAHCFPFDGSKTRSKRFSSFMSAWYAVSSETA